MWVWADGAIVVRRLGPDGHRIVGISEELPGFPLAAAAETVAADPAAATYELEERFEARLRADGAGGG